MADEFDQFPDAAGAADEWSQFPDAPTQAVPSSKASDEDLYDPADETHKKALRVGREVMRLLGQGATNLAEGVMALPKMAADIPINAANLAGANIPTFSSQSLADRPELAPQNDAERLGTAITRGIGATAGGIAVGAVAPAAAALASNPGMQLAGTVAAPVAADTAREMGAGETGQAVAALTAGAAPGLIGTGSVAGTRGAFRGGEAGRQTVADNIKTFARAGTTPSVGQATETRVARAAENVFASAPGGSGPVIAKAASQADDLAANIEKRASQLVRKTSAEQAGRKIQQAVSGEGGFVDRFKAKQGTLYDKLDAFFPAQRQVDVSKTREALKALNADIPGAPALSQWFKNARIKGIQGAFDKDTAPPALSTAGSPIERLQAAKSVEEIDRVAQSMKIGIDDAVGADIEDLYFNMRSALAKGTKSELTNDISGRLPYEAVKKLRTLVGNEMADAGLVSDVPRSKWKALYAALSSDMEKAVSGNAGAKAAWSRANNYTRAGLRRLETIDHVIEKNGGPEKIYLAATSGTKDGATTLRAVMQSLDDEGKRTLSATVLRRLGVAKNNVQDANQGKFSTETFLTNWNELGKEAKATLFDRYGPSYRADMDAIAKTAANLREGSQVFRNPSGTAQKAVLFTTVGSFFTLLGTGQVAAAGGIGAGVGAANLSARLMTNPRFVRWLAQTTKAPAGAYVAAVNSLASQAKQSGDVDLARAVALLEQNQRDQQQQDKGRQQN